MERFWNIIHYYVYRASYKSFLFINKINPVMLLYKTDSFKRRFKNMGVEDPIQYLNKSFERPDTGICITVAGGSMSIFIFFIFLGFSFLFSAFVTKNLDLEFVHFIVFILLSFVINHFVLFKKDKYLSYFKQVNKMNKKEKQKWAWISSLVVVGILSFFIGSFLVLGYRLNNI